MTEVKRSRFSDEQIISFLKQAGVGMPIKECCRNVGLRDATFFQVARQVRRHAELLNPAPA